MGKDTPCTRWPGEHDSTSVTQKKHHIKKVCKRQRRALYMKHVLIHQRFRISISICTSSQNRIYETEMKREIFTIIVVDLNIALNDG